MPPQLGEVNGLYTTMNAPLDFEFVLEGMMESGLEPLDPEWESWRNDKDAGELKYEPFLQTFGYH